MIVRSAVMGEARPEGSTADAAPTPATAVRATPRVQAEPAVPAMTREASGENGGRIGRSPVPATTAPRTQAAAPRTQTTIGHHIARYEFANSNPRTPCTDGRWQAGAYVQCEGPRLYEARWRKLIGTAGEGRYVPDRALLCEPHARTFCQRWSLHMPGEEPKEALAALRPQNGPLRGPERQLIEGDSVLGLGGPTGVGTARCADCYRAWADYPAGAVHVPAPGGCPHRCHQAVAV